MRNLARILSLHGQTVSVIKILNFKQKYSEKYYTCNTGTNVERSRIISFVSSTKLQNDNVFMRLLFFGNFDDFSREVQKFVFAENIVKIQSVTVFSLSRKFGIVSFMLSECTQIPLFCTIFKSKLKKITEHMKFYEYHTQFIYF